MKELGITEKKKIVEKVCNELEKAGIKHTLIAVFPESSDCNAFLNNDLEKEEFYIGMYILFHSIAEEIGCTVAEIANDVKNFVRRYDRNFGDLTRKIEVDKS